jgi:hypothetical protein
LQEPLAFLWQAINAGHKHALDGIGHGHLRQHVGTFQHRPSQLLQKERIAFRFRQDELHEGLGYLGTLQGRGHHSVTVLGGEQMQRQLGGIGLF